MLQIGQGILGKVRFADGGFPQYSRPYLVVSASNGQDGDCLDGMELQEIIKAIVE